MAHRRQGYRFENEWEPEMLESDAKYVAAGVTLPIYEEINLKNTVLNLDSVKRYLEKARKIAITDCPCRTKRRHCEAPRDVCIQLNEPAERDIASGKSREVTIGEALDAVTRAHNAGLVPMAYIRTDSPRPEGVNYICNCCSCCCSILGLTLRFGMAPHILKSIAITITDGSKCIACGKCVDRCHFGARDIREGKLGFNKDLCFGCGLCVSTCPSKAISLIPLL